MARQVFRSCDRKSGVISAFHRVLIWVLLGTAAWSPCTAQLLSTDVDALREIRNNLDDLPGSNFFSSWNFAQDPCSFEGVQCDQVDGVTRVVLLYIGEQTAGSPGLSGSLSPAVGNLTALSQFSIVPGIVGGPIPSTLGSLWRLQFLGLFGNRFTGGIPWSVSYLNRLQSVILTGNYLSGQIPSGFGQLPSLSTLSLAGNQLTDAVPDFSSAYSLRHLDLTSNELTGRLPLLPAGLEYLSLANNRITGGAERLSGLRSLTYLDVSSNELTGYLPVEVFTFPLQYLLLDRNKLSGNLAIPTPCSIPVVDLSYNNFSGEVPTALARVKTLYLNDNRFSGMVPPVYAANLQTAVVETLYLQHNYLIGLSNLLPGMSFPSDVTLCFQFNCGLPPLQSDCPGRSGSEDTRPVFDCLNPELHH